MNAPRKEAAAPPRLCDVAPAWQTLIKLAWQINFGRITGLEIVAGIPAAYANSVKAIVPGKDNAAAPRQHMKMPVHPSWAEVVNVAADHGRLTIACLELANGVPVRADLVQPGGFL